MDWDHVRAMFGPCLAYLYLKTSENSKFFKTEPTWSEAHVYGVYYFGLY